MIWGTRRTGNCAAPGCLKPVHAKGYCRCHYGQIWRRGTLYEVRRKKAHAEVMADGGREDRLRSLERELARARRMYDLTVGLSGRMRWRDEIRRLEAELQKLEAVK